MKERITLAYGDGGKKMQELLDRYRPKLSNEFLDELTDSAEFNINEERLAFTTDSYVVKPLFFPGADIGKLSVCGTINDLAMKAAKPLYISLSMIVEEGLKIEVLDRIVDSIKREADKAQIKVVTGDFKVVEKGACDKIYINTAGIGLIQYKGKITSKAKKGDAIIINGSIAEHGLTILNEREKLNFKSDIKSDCKNVSFQVERALAASGNIHVLRDPTRGGLATSLCEIASASKLGIQIDEKKIPIKEKVKRLSEVLGFDPLYVANEGKFVCFVKDEDKEKVKEAIGKDASVIGKVTSSYKSQVTIKTKLGSSRVLTSLEASQLPRIC